MNYYQAREVLRDGKGTGIWHWTRENDGAVWPSEPCTGECQHRSAEEAERHRYDYLRANLRVETWDDWSGCRACGEPTKETLGPRAGFGEPLCDAHRNAEVWERLHPFTPGMWRVASS